MTVTDSACCELNFVMCNCALCSEVSHIHESHYVSKILITLLTYCTICLCLLKSLAMATLSVGSRNKNKLGSLTPLAVKMASRSQEIRPVGVWVELATQYDCSAVVSYYLMVDLGVT